MVLFELLTIRMSDLNRNKIKHHSPSCTRKRAQGEPQMMTILEIVLLACLLYATGCGEGNACPPPPPTFYNAELSDCPTSELCFYDSTETEYTLRLDLEECQWELDEIFSNIGTESAPDR